MREFETNHFGLKYGADFPQVAELLRQNKNFMSTGMMVSMLSALEMGSIGRELKDKPESERGKFTEDLLAKPNTTHSTLAEIFYLGYQLGKQNAEVGALNTLASI